MRLMLREHIGWNTRSAMWDGTPVVVKFSDYTVGEPLYHPNIVQILGSYRNGTVMEMMHTSMKDMGKISRKRAIEISFELSKALVYIHNKGLRHGNIKPSNVFVEPSVKLGDTGFERSEYLDSVHFNNRFSDIYSLGVVMYCLLKNKKTLKDQEFLTISSLEARDPFVELIQKCTLEKPSMDEVFNTLQMLRFQTRKGFC